MADWRSDWRSEMVETVRGPVTEADAGTVGEIRWRRPTNRAAFMAFVREAVAHHRA